MSAGFVPKPYFPQEESLICEALVREISKAQRWMSIVEAWQALLHVRHMAKSLHDEGMQAEAKASSYTDSEVCPKSASS